MRKFLCLLAMTSALSVSQSVGANVGGGETVEDLKRQIVALAKAYEGQGDPDQSKQKTIEPLVDRLVALSPMPPVRDRIPVVAGVWKQVWGPYEYSKDDGSIDPKIGIREIYQVVFAEGYYYNVAPYYPNPGDGREQISLLRGEFTLDPANTNGLRVKFTRYPGADTRPRDLNIWELAALVEAGRLENEITIVPTWVVKTFFGGGVLDEVYTDSDLRIVFGKSSKQGSRRVLYVMTRVQ